MFLLRKMVSPLSGFLMPARRFRTVFFTVKITLWIFANPTMAESDGSNGVIIRIMGINPVEGQVRVALYNAAEKWLKESFYNAVLEVKSHEVEWRINNIPEGEYAVAAFHDQNGNGEADRNLVGIPKEAYGFSNNVKVVFRAPKWDEAKFRVANSAKKIEFELERWNIKSQYK